MALLGLQEIHYQIGGLSLFAGINLQIEPGDRLCILGRNGSGKSTLLRLMQGSLGPDRGEISRQQGLRVAALDQELPPPSQRTALETALAIGEPSLHPGDQPLQARRFLTRLGVEPEQIFGTLSGGNRRRVFLAGALAAEPDLLLLDEPTNHLDIETITWLEDELQVFTGAVVFVTHDRRFARRLATRTAEVDRGRLIALACGYETFLERRDDIFAAERQREAEFVKKMAQEETWIRRGVKARLKRDEGRVKALLRMREQWQQRRKEMGTARLTLQEAGRSGDLVLDAQALHFAFADRPIVSDFSRTVMRGERIGVMGRNGCGKTSLLRLLLGELAPSGGQVRTGTNLQVLYFDQLRAQIALNKSVQDNVGNGYDTVEINGKPQHILGYLDRFLFSPERARVPASILSGGERNRLLLAKLFTRPSNVLILDEPTNDLDAETLDLLEDILLEYAGTLFLVSHDREFLDNVVTSTWYLDGTGQIEETPGGWSDWVQRQAAKKVQASAEQRQDGTLRPSPRAAAEKPRKRSFKEERELEALPEQIATLEAEKTAIHQRLADPDIYRTAADQVTPLTQRLTVLEGTIEQAYQRWQELEAIGTP